MKPALLAATVQLAVLTWIVALILDPTPLETVPALVTGLGLLAMATVATVGMIVVGGRWAHRLALCALAFTVIVAILRPIDPIWFVAVGCTTLATIALFSPALTEGIRNLPSAAGPPPRAVIAPLLALAAPALLGLLGNDAQPWALLMVGVSAPIVALLYSRVIPGGLMSIRLLWPLMAVGLSPWLGWRAGSAAVALAVAIASVSWHASVRASYHPPREVGTTFPIPPELAPSEVLDAAEIDERGRRK